MREQGADVTGPSVEQAHDLADQRRVGEERQKAIHDASWWGALLSVLGTGPREHGAGERMAQAIVLADLAAIEVKKRGIVPPGVLLAGEPVQLRQGGAPNITMNIDVKDSDTLVRMLKVLEKSGAMTAAPDAVHAAFLGDVAAAQVRRGIELLELIKDQLRPFVLEDETFPGTLARILDGHRARMVGETRP